MPNIALLLLHPSMEVFPQTPVIWRKQPDDLHPLTSRDARDLRVKHVQAHSERTERQ